MFAGRFGRARAIGLQPGAPDGGIARCGQELRPVARKEPHAVRRAGRDRRRIGAHVLAFVVTEDLIVCQPVTIHAHGREIDGDDARDGLRMGQCDDDRPIVASDGPDFRSVRACGQPKAGRGEEDEIRHLFRNFVVKSLRPNALMILRMPASVIVERRFLPVAATRM